MYSICKQVARPKFPSPAVLTLRRVGIDEVHEAVDLVDHGDSAHSAEGLRELGGEADHVVFAHGHDLDRGRVFVVVRVAVGIVLRYKSWRLVTDYSHRESDMRQLTDTSLLACCDRIGTTEDRNSTSFLWAVFPLSHLKPFRSVCGFIFIAS